MAQIKLAVDSSLAYCENMSNKCETICWNDKRTSRIAEANWPKVVENLQRYNVHSSSDNGNTK
jgi:hypothetical protein